MDFISNSLGAVTSLIWSSTAPQPTLEQAIILEPPRHVLCCDGGGIRGVFTLEILKGVQDRLTCPISNHIDLLVGTSTGSIVAGGLAIGKSLDDLLKLYEEKGNTIFYRTSYGILGPKYDATKLEGLLEDYFGDTKISDTLRPTLIYATDESQETIKIFDSYEAKKYPSSTENVMIRHAIRSSTAAPSYFSAVQDGYNSLCDGGLVANNPSYTSLASIKYHFGWKAMDSLKMVSVGTGYFPAGISYGVGKDMGISQLLMNTDFFFRAPVRTNTLLSKTMLGDNLIRLNGILPKNISLDDYSPDSLRILKETALNYIKNNPEEIDLAAKMLRD